MKLKIVTITGADNKVDPDELIDISRKYPFVEWGILLNIKNDRPRYPSDDWINKKLTPSWINLARSGNLGNFRLSGHLCGSYVTDMRSGEFSFWNTSGCFKHIFQRFQLNFFGKEQSTYVQHLAAALNVLNDRQVIFSLDGVNDLLFDLVSSHSEKYGLNIVSMNDLSGGRGIVQKKWPKALKPFVGYAGGLTPENLEENLKLIEIAAGESEFWVDVESGVRTDDRFDLNKVRNFLSVASKFVD